MTSDVTGFICRCRPDGKAEADALLAKVREALHDPDPAEFISALVSELNWTYNAYFDLVACDQWFGVSAETWTQADGGKFSVYFQCDRVEDGMAACFDAFASRPKP